MRATKLLLVFAAAATLAACGTPRPASVGEGACKLAASPDYQVLGKTPHDQAWIDDTTEGLIAGCGQPRPKPRPAEWDAPPLPRKAPDANGSPAPRKPRTIMDLLRRRA